MTTSSPSLSSAELKRFPFLAGLPDDNLWHLARLMQTEEFPADSVLFNEGDPRKIFGVIISGSVSIEKGREGRSERLATLGAGEAIGDN